MARNLYKNCLPYEVKEFFEEYGPIILDVFLSLPLVHLFRSLIIRYRNQYKDEHSRSSISRLPDELLLEICSTIYFSGCPTSYKRGRQCRRPCHSFYATATLLNLSMTNKRMRNVAVHLVLQDVVVGRGYTQGWWRPSRALRSAEKSCLAQKVAKTFSVRVDVGEDKIRHPPWAFPRRLAQILPHYSAVRKLQLIVPNYSGRTFKKSFEKYDVALPNVRSLVLSSHLEWIISMCRNVEVLSTYGVHWVTSMDGVWPVEQPYIFINAAGRAPNLRHFEMHNEWNIEHLEAVLKSIPKIQSLAMPGRCYQDGIERLLPTLSRFRCLRTLAVGGAADLDVGFHPPGCGNVYLEPGGDAYWREVQEQGERATVNVGEMVFGRLEWLQELWVGDQCKITASPSVDGRKNITRTYEHRLLLIDMYQYR